MMLLLASTVLKRTVTENLKRYRDGKAFSHVPQEKKSENEREKDLPGFKQCQWARETLTRRGAALPYSWHCENL